MHDLPVTATTAVLTVLIEPYTTTYYFELAGRNMFGLGMPVRKQMGINNFLN